MKNQADVEKKIGGGDLVIGVIIFIILILIQFMVINKGSERVSEVTARFTLDAMPGKQMAIDADLNTGAITDAEAKKRREKIQEEASFFGSMDGAVKYVKGDAVAGLLITTINIVGGIIMGMTRQGMDITSALNKYAILTIGDGLVSQIPSLLISLSTGILVTKGSKDADFGTTLVSQLFGVPKGLYLVGAMLAILGFVTELCPCAKLPYNFRKIQRRFCQNQKILISIEGIQSPEFPRSSLRLCTFNGTVKQFRCHQRLHGFRLCQI